MDSFEINKVMGAVLGTIFLVFSVALISDAIFAAPVPHTPGYIIQASEAEAPAAGAEAAAPVSVATLLASADADAGATVFKKCQACHSGEKGGPNKVGPDLWGVVNRPIASHEGFSYSAAMKEFSEGGKKLWAFEELNGFIHAPKEHVKGTAMSFAGIKKDNERANLLAYLRTLSDDPAPLPTADAAPAAENASAPGGAAPAPENAAAPAGNNAPAPAADGAAPAAAPADGNAAAPASDNEAAPGTAAPAPSAQGATMAPAAEPATGNSAAPAGSNEAAPATASPAPASQGATTTPGAEPATDPAQPAQN